MAARIRRLVVGLAIALGALAGCMDPDQSDVRVVSVSDSLVADSGTPLAREYNITLPGPWSNPKFFMDFSFDNVTDLEIVAGPDKKCVGTLKEDRLRYRGLVCAFEFPDGDAPTTWRLRIETAGSGDFRLSVANGITPDEFSEEPSP